VQDIPLIIAPDPEEPEAAEVLIDGAVDGRPRRFLLDTGAARSQLIADPHTADLATVRIEASHGAIAETVNVLVRIPELAIGPLHARDIEVARVSAQQPGVHDLLGMDVLASACCRFDLAHRRLRIEASPNPDATLPLIMGERKHCYVELDWTNAQAQACFDTGAGMTVVDRSFIEEHPRLFEAAGTSAGTDATGAYVEMPMFLMAGPVIGGTQFASQTVAAIDLAPANARLDLPMDLILGYPIIRQASWLFDFPARRWSLSRVAPN
jgi:gag-polyprotein putative aspartyl protease